jgi:hypothetical protein
MSKPNVHINTFQRPLNPVAFRGIGVRLLYFFFMVASLALSFISASLLCRAQRAKLLGSKLMLVSPILSIAEDCVAWPQMK